MSIRTRNIHRTSVMHPDVMGSPFMMPVAAAEYFVAEVDEDHASHVVGGYLTLAKTIMPGSPCAIHLLAEHSTNASVYEFIGINQFGDRVVERIDTTGATLKFWTAWAYKELISVQVISEANVTKFIKIGLTLETPRLGLPFVPVKAAEVITSINPAGTEEAVTSVNLATSTATTATWAAGGMGMILSSLSNYGLRP